MSRINVANFRHPDGTSDNIVLDSSGRVGIGTTSPSSLLHINNTSADPQIRITSAAATTGFTIDQVGGNIIFNNRENNYLAFCTNNSERARLDTSGNLQFNSGYGSVATAYGCRAWVNFNGQGTVAIRASGNVSSITDNGAGDYTVNFTTAMPDANYASAGQAGNEENSAQGTTTSVRNVNKATGSCRISTNFATSNMFDFSQVSFIVFR